MNKAWNSSPISMTELGIYLDWQKNLQGTAYNQPLLLPLPKGTDLKRLEDALQETLRAHPGLLSRFHMDEDGRVQRMMPDSDAEDLSVKIGEIEGEPDSDTLIRPFTDPEGDLYHLCIIRGNGRACLFADFHHIVCDGASIPVFVRDLDRAYAGEVLAREDTTAADFALREQKARQTDAFDRAGKWYEGLLGDAEICSAPIYDHESGEAKNACLEMPLALDADTVRTYAEKAGIKISTFFTGVYGYLLSRFSGANQSLYASIRSDRDEENAQSIGMFVKTFPIMESFEREETIADHLKELEKQILASWESRLFSYADIHERFHPSIPTIFAYQGEMACETDFLGGRIIPEILQSDDPKGEVLSEVFRRNGVYSLRISYRTDLYDPGSMEIFARSFDKTAGEFLIRETFAQVDFTSAQDRNSLDRVNDTAVDYPEADIVSLFRAAAEQYPGNRAVIFGDRVYTYAEVDEITDRIAGYLRMQGIRRGHVVSILIPRSEYMPIAALGVLKSGAAYQPLDPSYPVERLSFMMKDADCGLLIAEETLLDLVPEYTGPVLLTKDIPSLPACAKPEDHPQPEDLFILLYTSGSTGVPKGVMLEHRNLCNFCHWYRDYYQLDDTCRVAAYASFGFDACMMDMYPALITGACVCIAEEAIRLDLVALESWFNRLGITHSFMTTQVGRQFYTMTETETLRYLSVGGEKLVPVRPKKGMLQFINGYGPTECTIFSTFMPVDRLYDRVPIGKPLANYRCYVVDEQLRRLPPLVPGELLIAGRGVGRGYLNRPELTEKAFIPNPFSDDPDYACAYRTGDVVRLMPDGTIDFIGRNDGQVKVRGFRIELTEVESVIRAFPGIRDATVQAFEDEHTGEKFIAAYVVSEQGVDVHALNAFIRERKPAYMVPAATVQLDAIPLNQNQKVNKRALPKPEMKAQPKEAGHAAAAPMNVLEQKLKAIISEITGSEDFGITDLFGDLGLTSISGIRLAVQIFRQFGVQMKAQELITEGSIQRVENAILEKMLDQKEADAEAPVQPEGAPSRCRLSFAQQGVYAECQIDPDDVTYNLPFVLRFPDGTDAQALKAAVLSVAEAHPYILCRFAADENNEIIQTPIPDFELDIPVTEMTAEAFDGYQRAFVRPFDLENGPLVRFEIVRADALYLLADMHHLVSDGASMDIFFRQLCLALDGEKPKKEDYDYYDFVAEERIEPEVEAFFAERMAEVEDATQLIPDIFEENLPHREKSVRVPTDFAAVEAFARASGVTPAGVYLAATFLTYGRYVCEDTVSIATISNGRSNVRLADTIGMFVNTLPLAVTLDNREETLTYLRRVAKIFSDTIEHENYPFARIASKYDFHPMASYTYQVGVISRYDTQRGAVRAEEIGTGRAKVPVGIYITGEAGAEVIQVTYDSALYSEAMMRGVAESVENAVQGLMTCESLGDISLTGEQQWQMLDTFNKPWDLDYNRADTVVSVFKRNAGMQPDKVAAVFEDKAYTYRQLDELTDRLAAKLYKRVSEITGKTNLAEEVAAILLSRNEHVFILPLAAVKAGLAYEPLDPSYPKERLNFMVKDAGACLLLAEEDLLDHVDEYTGAVLTVRELYDMPEAPAVPVNPKPEDLFIMLYTSGSTGAPKGCQIEHRNLIAYAHGMRNDFCRRDDRIAAYASFGFDVNMSDVFCTLLNGGTVCLVPEAVRMDLGKLAGWFDEMQITALVLTTQVGVQFLQTFPEQKSLRMLIMGGEKLPAVDPSRLNYRIVNGYGPTENCCGVSLFPIEHWEPNIPIGRPFPSIHAYVLDKTGHRLPAGAAGEYCLSGPQVTRGYLNRPDKTAEAYEACPFNEYRMYHTGDIVRYRQNGDVEFVGRKDGQVKIRGFRVEMKEVEAVIRKFEGIRDVTVQAYDFENGGKYLAAFIVSDTVIDPPAVAAFIRGQKPAYMVPAVLQQIDKIPLTVNQKVDKKALPKPTLQKAAYVAPENKAEEDFCAIFAGALGLERVSVADDFFEMGGSSIIAMKVVVAAGKAGYDIVYNDVFRHTTPRDMAAFVTGGTTQPVLPGAAEEAPKELPEIGRDGYDYRPIHALLSRNTLEAFRNGERLPLHDVLLLGGTGYLGCHVLHELIVNHGMKLCCLVRPGQAESGEARLKNMLSHYFGSDFAELFGTRITVIEGDATDPAALESFKAPAKEMTVINCAASVKHFARGNEIDRVNIGSVQNIIAWCERNGARLVHISTGSIIGSREGSLPPRGYQFDEHRLYAGQNVDDNQYIHSKFLSERHIYEAMLNRGLRAKVLRVGNLAPRVSDGAFQINYRTNNSMNTFRAFATLGMMPYDVLDQQTEFSPIDSLARAVLALATTPEACVCFFPLNPHRPLMADVSKVLTDMGYPIHGVEAETFGAALSAALQDENKRDAVGSLVAYQSNGDLEEIGLESCDIRQTTGMLERLGFSWPETGTAYIRSFLEKLDEKNFFGET